MKVSNLMLSFSHQFQIIKSETGKGYIDCFVISMVAIFVCKYPVTYISLKTFVRKYGLIAMCYPTSHKGVNAGMRKKNQRQQKWTLQQTTENYMNVNNIKQGYRIKYGKRKDIFIQNQKD